MMDRFGNDQDTEIVELLGRLKETGPEYPPRLYAARRAAVIAALAALPIGGALAVGLFAKLAGVVKSMSVVDKIVLALELTAITGVTALGAATAYVYRDQLKTMLFPPKPTTTIGTLAPLSTSSPEPALPVFGGTPSETPTPTGTIYLTDTNLPPGDQQPAETQAPPVKATPTNPGNHYGQTEQPPPTKKP